MIDFFSDHMMWFYVFVGIFGACIGSFLNVVIHRLPLMIERNWKEECNELFKTSIPIDTSEKLNLCCPRSACPQCQCTIPFYYNIPLLSYLLLRGRCAQCQCAISIRYFLIELFTTVISVFVAYYYGLSVQTLFALGFSWLLIALMCIDYQHYILPDSLNFTLLWLGILANVYELFIPLNESVLGVMIGYASLWGFAMLFYLITKKEGMGHGDFKLFAALGAWVGWQQLLLVIVGASVVGAILGISLICIKGRDKSQALPFGPFLGISGWIVFFFGEWITHQYFSMLVTHY